MDIERKLYNKFVDVLNDKLDNPEVTAKELEVVMNFLKYNNIQANAAKNPKLQGLTEKAANILPFNCDELPEKKVT